MVICVTMLTTATQTLRLGQVLARRNVL